MIQIIEDETKIGVSGYARVYKIKKRKELPKKDDIDTFEWLIEKGELISETKNTILAGGAEEITKFFEGTYTSLNWEIYLDQETNDPAVCETTNNPLSSNYALSSITGKSCDYSSNPTENYFYGYFPFKTSWGSPPTEYQSIGIASQGGYNHYKRTRALLSPTVFYGYAFDVLVKYIIQITFGSDFTSHYRERVCQNIANRGNNWVSNLYFWSYNNDGGTYSWNGVSVSRAYRRHYCDASDPEIGYAMWYASISGNFGDTVTKVAFSDSASDPDTAPGNVFWQKNVSFTKQNKAYFLKLKITYN